MPTRYGLGSVVSNSIVADGCLIEGEVENCVLFRGVQVHKGAKLRNCVIMQDSIIGENSRLDFVVADKDTVFDPNRTLMGYQTYPCLWPRAARCNQSARPASGPAWLTAGGPRQHGERGRTL